MKVRNYKCNPNNFFQILRHYYSSMKVKEMDRMFNIAWSPQTQQQEQPINKVIDSFGPGLGVTVSHSKLLRSLALAS